MVPSEVFQRLDQQLANFIGGDSKFRDNSLLRPPGTLNHKGRAKGENSYPVILCDDEYDIDPWHPAALSEVLGPLPSHPTKAKGGKSKKRISGKTRRRRTPEVTPVEAEPLPQHLPDEITRLVHLASKKASKVDRSRSGQLYGLVFAAMAHGYSDGQIMAIGRLSEPGQEKWPNPHDLQVAVQRCIDKLRPQHKHVGLAVKRPAVHQVAIASPVTSRPLATSFDVGTDQPAPCRRSPRLWRPCCNVLS